MPRTLKIMVLALVILVGLRLAISGLYNCCATTIGGMYVTTMDDCFFLPDFAGRIRQVWQTGIAISGVLLIWIGSRLLADAMMQDQPCHCFSGRSYRRCCFRRERANLVIGVLTAGAVVGIHRLDSSVVSDIWILFAAAPAFWLVSRRYKRSRHHVKRA